MNINMTAKTICAIGDTHGHLQLALCMAARWQHSLGLRFDAVLLCGDVGTFTHESQLDGTTRSHAKKNPCELEFLYQWSASPFPAYLRKIFAPITDSGLGLECPVIMTHGNHEGFSHLASIVTNMMANTGGAGSTAVIGSKGNTGVPGKIPVNPVPVYTLPFVDKGNFIRYLPTGWKCFTPSGLVIGAIGGIERDQRSADYHEMAYIDEQAVESLLEGPKFDILITHQGPSSTQTDTKGSTTLQLLLDLPGEEIARIWFHGHSIVDPRIHQVGPNHGMLIVPLEDAAFPGKGLNADDPGDMAWCWASIDKEIKYEQKRPDSWRDYRKNKWRQLDNHQLVCPDLI